MSEVRLILGDCLKVLPTLDRRDFGALICDPPYGIDLQPGQLRNSIAHPKVIGDDKPFDPAPLLAMDLPTVLWGANNYADKLPPSGGWLVWDKATRNGMDLRIAEYEFAWTNTTRRHQGFRHMWSGAYRDSERGTAYHPCQKPVELFLWCIEVARLQPGSVVLDPYMGSGGLGVACVRAGLGYVGIEIDPTYFAIAERRIREAQSTLWTAPTPKQPDPELYPTNKEKP